MQGLKVYDTLAQALPRPQPLTGLVLAVCERGSLTAVVNNAELALPQGAIAVLRPGHHVGRCASSDDFRGYIIAADREQVDMLLPAMQSMVPARMFMLDSPLAVPAAPSELASLRATYDALQLRLTHPQGPFADLALAALCRVLFYDVLGIYMANLPSAAHSARSQELVAAFAQLLEANFRSQRTVAYYAGRLFVTPKHLSALLRKASGRCASAWIDLRVMAEARDMLLNTGMSIQEIAQALNFGNQSLFGKFFKASTGVSPRQYRKSRRP